MDEHEPQEARAPEELRRTNEYLLPGSILIAAILISGSIAYLVKSNGAARVPAGGAVRVEGQTANVGNAAGVVAERDVVLGDPNAPVIVIEYGDYQCPYCALFFSQVEPQLRKNYITTGKVKMVFRNFQFLGAESVAAAEAAECAKDQNQFWSFHDALYSAEGDDGKERNGNLNRDLFLNIASDLKLDAAAFTACLDNGTYAKKIQGDTLQAQEYGVNSTPTTFVNGVLAADASGRSVGANAAAIFSFIDAALAGK